MPKLGGEGMGFDVEVWVLGEEGASSMRVRLQIYLGVRPGRYPLLPVPGRVRSTPSLRTPVRSGGKNLLKGA